MGEVHVQFEFEGDLRQSLHKAAFLFDRDYCPLDGFRDSDIWYDVREQDTEKGKFIFVNRKCKAVDGRIASSKLGERKDDKGYFWHEWRCTRQLLHPLHPMMRTTNRHSKSMKLTKSQQAIYDYLKQHGEATYRELNDNFFMRKSDMRIAEINHRRRS